jgi:hypothetical protein
MKKVIIDEQKTQFPRSLEYATELVKFFSETFPDEIRFWKIALVAASNFKAILDFWEFQANKMGYGYKVFSSIEEARKFLND